MRMQVANAFYILLAWVPACLESFEALGDAMRCMLLTVGHQVDWTTACGWVFTGGATCGQHWQQDRMSPAVVGGCREGRLSGCCLIMLCGCRMLKCVAAPHIFIQVPVEIHSKQPATYFRLLWRVCARDAATVLRR